MDKITTRRIKANKKTNSRISKTIPVWNVKGLKRSDKSKPGKTKFSNLSTKEKQIFLSLQNVNK